MKTLILVLIILVVFLVLLYFLVFNKSTITSPQKVNITNISYSIFNNSYISKTLNFTFTPYFIPWKYTNDSFVGYYNSLLLLPIYTNQSNISFPFNLTFISVVSYATDNTSTQILNEYVSGLKENYPNGTSSYKKIDLLGTQGYYVNFSYAANKTYYSAFAVLNNTAYSVLLNLANQSLYNVSINAFSTILRTLST